jgi:16S rRNA (cytosine967-C5)-methyltransferase
VLETLAPEWLSSVTLDTKAKLSFLHADQEALSVFPWIDELSETIDHRLFGNSFLVQPDLFVRVRPGYESIKNKLLQAGGRDCGDLCVALPNTFPLQEIVTPDVEVVVQDKNSQSIAKYLDKVDDHRAWKIWDCCAASGGKSILAFDHLTIDKLTVSDIRSSVLSNLRQRFVLAGIKSYESLMLDLSERVHPDPAEKYDLIICDVPCSGSGTWSRTPEQLYYFDIKETQRYAALQKKIAGNAIASLRKGGYFLYITCSVFRKENEEVVEYLESQSGLTLMQSGLEKGYEDRADTLFAALFTV